MISGQGNEWKGAGTTCLINIRMIYFGQEANLLPKLNELKKIKITKPKIGMQQPNYSKGTTVKKHTGRRNSNYDFPQRN